MLVMGSSSRNSTERVLVGRELLFAPGDEFFFGRVVSRVLDGHGLDLLAMGVVARTAQRVLAMARSARSQTRNASSVSWRRRFSHSLEIADRTITGAAARDECQRDKWYAIKPP